MANVELSQRFASRRGDRPLREVAEEIGVSASTLSRLENRQNIDLVTFSKVKDWLDAADGISRYRLQISATGTVDAKSPKEAREIAFRSLPEWGVYTSFDAQPWPNGPEPMGREKSHSE